MYVYLPPPCYTLREWPLPPEDHTLHPPDPPDPPGEWLPYRMVRSVQEERRNLVSGQREEMVLPFHHVLPVTQASKEDGQVCIVSHTFTSCLSLSSRSPYQIAHESPAGGVPAGVPAGRVPAPGDLPAADFSTPNASEAVSAPDADFGVVIFDEGMLATNVGVSGHVPDTLELLDLPEANAVVNVRADEHDPLLFDNSENNCIAFRGAYGEG